MIALTRLKKSEHVEYHQSSLMALRREAKKCPLLSAGLLDAYEEAIRVETTLAGRIRSSEIVKQYLDEDVARDKMYRFLRAKLKMLSCGLNTKGAALLQENLKQFNIKFDSRVTKQSRERKANTYRIFAGMLHKLEQVFGGDEEFAIALARFEQSNKVCAELEEQRIYERQSYKPGQLLEARAKTDALYRSICKLLEGYAETLTFAEGVDSQLPAAVGKVLDEVSALEKEKRKSMRIREAWRVYKRKRKEECLKQETPVCRVEECQESSEGDMPQSVGLDAYS